MSEADRLISQAITVLADANGIAAATRAEADRYAQRRQAEADLVIQKAQRVLLAAEAKAAVIVRTAIEHVVEVEVEVEVEADAVIDLDAVAAEMQEPVAPRRPAEPTSELDRLLEAAIGRAVTHAFPVDATR